MPVKIVIVQVELASKEHQIEYMTNSAGRTKPYML